MFKKGKRVFLLCAAAIVIALAAGCSSGTKEVIFADAGWDSIRFHNAIAGFIAVNAYGYDSWSEVSGTTPVTHEGMLKGEINVHMEEWTANIAAYPKDLADGKFVELGINFDDNMQGLYVPRYVIEGDADRGIAPMAPGLKTVKDLAKYKDVFTDPEDKTKGRIYGSIPGWEVDKIMQNKYKLYGLDSDFVYFSPGSDAALAAVFTSAYDKGEAMVGYYWEPTWLIGKYDFVLLEDEPYTNEEDYMAGKTACPAVVCTTAASNDFYKKDPDFCKFVANYKTTSALISEALAYMQDTGASTEETAKWFMREHDDLLDTWLDADRAAKVREALK